jgi:hypothetical protein
MRRKNARNGPGAFAAAQAASTSIASMPTAALADPTMLGKSQAGLPYPRVQADVADQPLRIGELSHLADRHYQVSGND